MMHSLPSQEKRLSPEEMAAHCEANGDVKFGMTGSSGTASMTSHKLNAIYHGRTSSPVKQTRAQDEEGV